MLLTDKKAFQSKTTAHLPIGGVGGPQVKPKFEQVLEREGSKMSMWQGKGF